MSSQESFPTNEQVPVDPDQQFGYLPDAQAQMFAEAIMTTPLTDSSVNEPQIIETDNELKHEKGFGLHAPTLDEAIATASGTLLFAHTSGDSALGEKIYHKYGSKGYKSDIYEVGEKEYLEATKIFLEEALLVAEQKDPKEIAFSLDNTPDGNPSNLPDTTYKDTADYINQVLDKMIFINNAEFEHATDIMAGRIVEEAMQGNIVALYDYKDRSPRYVITKVLDKVSKQIFDKEKFTPEQSAELQSQILYGTYPDTLITEAGKRSLNKNNAPINYYAVDDFAVSNNLIAGAIGQIESAIPNDQKEKSKVKAMLICGSEDLGNTAGKIESVYKARRPEGDNIIVAGSWSSTDFGYENVIQRISERTGVKHTIDATVNNSYPVHYIKGRYDKDIDGKYVDPEYAEKYQKILDTFGVIYEPENLMV